MRNRLTSTATSKIRAMCFVRNKMKNGHKPRRAMPIDAHGGTYTKMPKTGKFGRSFLDATGFDWERGNKKHALRACSCVGNKNTPIGRVLPC